MRLSALAGEDGMIEGDVDIDVRGLKADSREVGAGDLFAALRGARADGFAFVASAVAAGAVAVLGDARLAAVDLPVSKVVANDPRRLLALMAARFYGRQPAHVVAVTGTNGKTSTASFTAQLWRASGLAAASLGTLGLDAPGFPEGASLTTPDPVALHETLSALALADIEYAVMEASSHGLDQRRLDGVRLEAAAFLNLTRDHLDYHGSEAAYLAAKWRLFDTLLPRGAKAVLNADMPHFPELAAAARHRGLEVIDIGRRAGRYRLVEQRPEAAGQHLGLIVEGWRHEVFLPVVGAFQGQNLLAALALAHAAGVPLERLLAAVPRLRGPRGRMELVATHASGAPVFVDYAHTPDALEQALQGLRPHAAGKLVVVFGCGGDRDPGKRPQMGAIAARLADCVIVTDDNPRGEQPAAIRRAILAAAPAATEIGDRAAAIREAIAGLGSDDVLLIAGKGHEQGQIVGAQTLPFDDAAVARELVGDIGAAA